MGGATVRGRAPDAVVWNERQGRLGKGNGRGNIHDPGPQAEDEQAAVHSRVSENEARNRVERGSWSYEGK